MDKPKYISYETNVLEFGEVNDGFAKVLISVMSCDQVANGTKFTRESVDKAVKGLNYLPVVGEWIGDKEDLSEGDFGTHGGKLTISDSEFKWEDTTIPYGVVIADSYHWKDMTKKNGETEQYLCVYAYLWLSKFPEIEKIYRDGRTNQSMEILVNNGEYTDTYFEITDFSFQAIALLGKTVKPAFEQAQVITQFESNTFKAQYNEMLLALDKYMTKYEEKEDDVVENEEQKIDDTEIIDEQPEEVVDTDEVEDTTEPEQPIDVIDEEEVDDEVVVDEEFVEEVQQEVQQEAIDTTDYKSLYEQQLEKVVEMQKTIDEYISKEIRLEKTKMADVYTGKIEEETLAKIYENIDTYSKESLQIELLTQYTKSLESKKFTVESVNTVPLPNNFEDDSVSDPVIKLVKKYSKK